MIFFMWFQHVHADTGHIHSSESARKMEDKRIAPKNILKNVLFHHHISETLGEKSSIVDSVVMHERLLRGHFQEVCAAVKECLVVLFI